MPSYTNLLAYPYRNVCCTGNGPSGPQGGYTLFSVFSQLLWLPLLHFHYPPGANQTLASPNPIRFHLILPPPPHITTGRRRNTFPLTTIFQDLNSGSQSRRSIFPLVYRIRTLQVFHARRGFAESNSLPRRLSCFPSVCLTWSMSRPQGPTASM